MVFVFLVAPNLCLAVPNRNSKLILPWGTMHECFVASLPVETFKFVYQIHLNKVNYVRVDLRPPPISNCWENPTTIKK